MHERKAVEDAATQRSDVLLRLLALAWLEAHPVCPACDGRGIAVDYGIAPDETCSPCRGLGYCDKAAPDQIIKDQIKVDTRMKALLECAGALCGPCSEGDRPENRIEFSFRRSHIWKTGNGHSLCEASLIWDKLIEPQSPTCHGLGYRLHG